MGIERGERPLGKVSLPTPLSSKAPASVSIRRAGPSDLDAIVGLRIEFERITRDSGSMDEALRRAELLSLLGPDLEAGLLAAWLAEDSGRVVAASGLRLPEGRTPGAARGRGGPPPGEGEILNMYTVPAYRRRGLGSELLGLAVGEARERGLMRLRLQPTDEGRPLYEVAGFRDEGRDMVLDLGAGGKEGKP